MGQLGGGQQRHLTAWRSTGPEDIRHHLTVAETTFMVPVARCRFTVQAISVDHIFPDGLILCEEGPIVVSRMNDGNWFVHNGRHRVIRALLNGVLHIEATELDGAAT